MQENSGFVSLSLSVSFSIASLCRRNLLWGSAAGFTRQCSESETVPPGTTSPGAYPASAPVPEPTPAPGLNPAPSLPPADELFRQSMKTFIEKVQDQASASAELGEEASDRPLKAKNPDLYYGNSQMECYYLGQQCEDHFQTAGAKGHRCVLFAASFLKEKILF